MTPEPAIPVAVRPVAPEDRAAWLRMRGELWPEDDHAAEVDAFLRGERRIAETVLVASHGADLVGFIEVNLRSHGEGCVASPVAYVEGWFVDAAWRRQGVGRTLMEAAERWARARGLTELGSDANIDNRASEAAHRALGFAVTSRIVTFRKPLAD